MCSTGPIEFRWVKGYTYNPSYHHHKIGSIQLSDCCHIFLWFYVWDGMVVLSCSLIYYIYNPGTVGPCFHYWCAVYAIWKRSDTYGLWVVFVCLQIAPSHYHHYSDISEGIKLSKRLSGICPSVCLRLRQYINYLLSNIWGCAFLA